MKYQDTTLILDNFRSILSSFPVDVQDVVRSAILDDTDISKYINQCKHNPYRLEQIRLATKEGVSDKYFDITSGDILYRVRHLVKSGKLVNSAWKYLTSSNPETLRYVLKWIEDGVPIGGLDMSLIPVELLDVFDFGLRQGYNMKEFNTGKKFNPDYLRYLLRIRANGKPIEEFVKHDWNLDVIKQLCSIAGSNIQYWSKVVRYIDYTITLERLLPLLRCVDSGMPIKDINRKDDTGEYVYDLMCISILHNAFLHKLDCKTLLQETTAEGMQELYNEMELEKRKKSAISGRLRKSSRVSPNNV